MNDLEETMVTCTVGELLVQLRLLEHGVQAAPPLKDSGNDLIAIRGNAFRAIQVKATRNAESIFKFNDEKLKNRLYDVLALVQVLGEGSTLWLDKCDVFLITKDAVDKGYYRSQNLSQYKLSPEVVDALFGSK